MQDKEFVVRQLQLTKDWACGGCHKTGNIITITSRGAMVTDCMCTTARRIKGRRGELFERSNMPERYRGANLSTWQNMGRDPREISLNHASYHVVEKFAAKLPQMVSEGYSLFLTGPHGVGKTYLSCCVGNAAIVHNMSVSYYTMATIIQLEITGWRDDEARVALRRVRASDILIIDDLDKVYKTKTGIESSLFDNLLRERLQAMKSCIFTSNKTVGDLALDFGPAVASMLSERCVELVVTGADHRQMDADNVRRAILND